MFSQLELPWGDFADAWFTVVSAINLNLELTSPEWCVAVRSAGLWLTVCTSVLPAVATRGC